jgi:hypothetical protein
MHSESDMGDYHNGKNAADGTYHDGDMHGDMHGDMTHDGKDWE